MAPELDLIAVVRKFSRFGDLGHAGGYILKHELCLVSANGFDE